MLRTVLLGLMLMGSGHACIWDRDTLEEEAKGRPEMVRIIVGWFNQYPDRYYEMRLGRVRAEIESEPENLALYDAGMRSIHPVEAVRERVAPEHSPFLEEDRRKNMEEYFFLARQAAEARKQAWLAYQAERYGEEMHPDTHPDFWDEWIDPMLPEAPGPSIRDRIGAVVKNSIILLSAFGAIIGLIAWLLIRLLAQLGHRLRNRMGRSDHPQG